MFYPDLAKFAVETFVKEGVIPQATEPVLPDLPSELLERQAGAFVSIHKNGELRGCIGTIIAVRENLATEIIHNAVSAATRDPRFDPVDENELELLTYKVDVLSEPEEVRDMSDLDPKHYGVIVKAGYRRGVLLPDLDGVDSVELQVSIALRKANICPDEAYTVERFTVERHEAEYDD